jgi:outer membrane protein TolC
VASSRASVQAAELSARARSLGVLVARADLLPTVSVFFNQGYQAFPLTGIPTDRGRVSNEFCPDGAPTGRTCNNGGWFRDRSVGLQLSWALFDGLRTKGAIDLAQAQAAIAQLQLEQQREAVSVEAARARAEFDRSRAQFEARRLTGGQAAEAFQLASLRFTRGLGTQLEVSDAQLALFTAETNEARAVFDLYLSYAELARAEGRPIPLPPSGIAPARLTLAPDIRGQTPSSPP